MHWRRKWQPTPVFLPGESPGRGSLVGCHLWGRTESDMTEAAQQQQEEQQQFGLSLPSPYIALPLRFNHDFKNYDDSSSAGALVTDL